MKVVLEVSNTLVSQGIVVPLPREYFSDVILRLERLHSLANLQVRHFQQMMLVDKILLGSNDAFREKEFVNDQDVLLWD
jgi:hypothetical protein